MESKSDGSVISHYQDEDGVQYERYQVEKQVLDALVGCKLTAPELSAKLRIKLPSLYNVIAVLVRTKAIGKERTGRKAKYAYRLLDNCLLAEMLYPTPEDVEKKFNIKGRQKYTPENGTSKSFGSGAGVNPFRQSSIDSVYWEGSD